LRWLSASINWSFSDLLAPVKIRSYLPQFKTGRLTAQLPFFNGNCAGSFNI